MASNTVRRLAGPVALANGTYITNIYNPPAASGGVGNAAVPYAIIRQIRIANTAATALTYRLQVGATGAAAAGTRIAYDVSVAAGAVSDIFLALRLDAADFLVGGASGSGLEITVMGEVGA
jgi:hypothetical protein